MRNRTLSLILTGLLFLGVGCGKKEQQNPQAGFIEDVPDAPVYDMPMGSPTPLADVLMKNVDGSLISIEDVKGEHGVLVLFLANDCPDVRTWAEEIRTVAAICRQNKIGVIGLNPNDPGKNENEGFDFNKGIAQQLDFSFPYVVDATSGLALAFGASRTPEAFLFNAEGKMVYHGAIVIDRNDTVLRKAVEQMLRSEKVETAKTELSGCPILWRRNS